MSEDRQYAHATLRNRGFVFDVFRAVLPATGVILEVASGSGEHLVHCAVFRVSFSNLRILIPMHG